LQNSSVQRNNSRKQISMESSMNKSIKQQQTNTTMLTSSTTSLALSSSTKSKPKSQSKNAYLFMLARNKMLDDLTRAIQLVHKAYLEKESENQVMTNSDYQVHDLCEQFDNIFLYG
jgi:hypothetical protein